MKKTFSFLVILMLGAAIPLTAYLLGNQQFDFRINAFLNDEPRNVLVTNIKGSSAIITWMTEKEVVGSVQMVNDQNLLTVEETAGSFHALKVNFLQPGTDYPFTIYSDGVEYIDSTYTFKKNSVLDRNDPQFFIYGQVFNTQGTGFQTSGLALISIQDGSLVSQKVPAVINKAGGYQADLSGVFDSGGNVFMEYNKEVLVIVDVYYAVDKDPIQKRFTINLNNTRQIPNIYLGDINIDTIPGINGD